MFSSVKDDLNVRTLRKDGDEVMTSLKVLFYSWEWQMEREVSICARLHSSEACYSRQG